VGVEETVGTEGAHLSGISDTHTEAEALGAVRHAVEAVAVTDAERHMERALVAVVGAVGAADAVGSKANLDGT